MTPDENSIISHIAADAAAPAPGALHFLGRRGVNTSWMLLRHGRRFFLKGLAADKAADFRYKAMLRKEFDLGARLDHPAIAGVFAMENIEGVGECIVMEWVEGLTLGRWLRTAPPLRQRLAVAREMADALAYAAARGVCHRDLKPDNVMVTSTGHARVIDFGLGDSDDYDLLKQSVATERYGAPEQMQGTGHAGPQADVYSFGCLLRDMHLPRRYRSVMAACMRREPAERPDMAQVVAMIDAAERRHRTLPVVAVWGAAAALLLAAVAALLLTYDNRRDAREDTPAEVPAEFSAEVPMPADSVAATPSGSSAPAPAPAVTPEVRPVPSDASSKSPAADTAAAAALEDAKKGIDAVLERYVASIGDGDETPEEWYARMQKRNDDIKAVYTDFEARLQALGMGPAEIETYRMALATYNSRAISSLVPDPHPATKALSK